MDCPSCGSSGEESSWCTGCGGPLAGAQCRSCSTELKPGAANCGECGVATKETGGGDRAWAPMFLAAAGLAVVGAVYMQGGGNEQAPPPRAPAAAQPMPPPPVPDFAAAPSNSALEAADAAFNVAMMAYETKKPDATGRIAEAIAAYSKVDEPDNDSLFHIAVLQQSAGSFDASLAATSKMLAGSPDHLLALGVAMQNSLELGDAAKAREYAQHFLLVLPSESGKSLREYRDHARMFQIYEQEAQTAIGG